MNPTHSMVLRCRECKHDHGQAGRGGEPDICRWCEQGDDCPGYRRVMPAEPERHGEIESARESREG